MRSVPAKLLGSLRMLSQPVHTAVQRTLVQPLISLAPHSWWWAGQTRPAWLSPAFQIHTEVVIVEEAD
jgi:hypothetical protein